MRSKGPTCHVTAMYEMNLPAESIYEANLPADNVKQRKKKKKKERKKERKKRRKVGGTMATQTGRTSMVRQGASLGV